ncbi:MAG: phosphoglycerate kinase [Candidatus Woesearchaeota archaeon]
MKFYGLDDFDFCGKRVLVRVDFNVPLSGGKITDDLKIKKGLTTIHYILQKQPSQLIMISHLGRPEGKYVAEMSLKPVAQRVSELLDRPVALANDCLSDVPEDEIVLMENLRFHTEEEANDEKFAKKLASCAELYVNDAFGTAHRAHASNNAVTRFLPSCAGHLMQKEIENLSKALYPKHPYVAIVGGAKADKITFIRELGQHADKLLFGGVLANTVLKAIGTDIGSSLYDKETLGTAKKLYADLGKKIVLPVDAVVANKFSDDAESKIVDVGNIPNGWLILDIGPKTIALFKAELEKAKTITWTGCIGVFEFARFAKGTEELAEFLAESEAVTIIGGGDSAASIEKYQLEDKMTHIGTGGGATLDYLGGKELPALTALEENFAKFSRVKEQ